MTFERLGSILYYPTNLALIAGLPLIFAGLMIWAVIEHVYFYVKTNGTMIVLSSKSRPQDPGITR